jgi:integrase
MPGNSAIQPADQRERAATIQTANYNLQQRESGFIADQNVTMTVSAAVDEFLATHELANSTHIVWRNFLRRLAREIGAMRPIDNISTAEVVGWFRSAHEDKRPGTSNSHRIIMLSFTSWLREEELADWNISRIKPRKNPVDRTRALDRARVDALLTLTTASLRERCYWTMLYESAARASEILNLDVEDLDIPNRRARVTSKGGAVEWVHWQTRTARLLGRYLGGRKSGPVFVTTRRRTAALSDTDPTTGHTRLSYRSAERLFTTASGGATLHQLRHSALTHAAEDGWSGPMLMARSRHKSAASLARYARPSAEAVAKAVAASDPERRR